MTNQHYLGLRLFRVKDEIGAAEVGPLVHSSQWYHNHTNKVRTFTTVCTLSANTFPVQILFAGSIVAIRTGDMVGS